MSPVIDFLAEIIVTVAFFITLIVVPAWLGGLIPGKGTAQHAPSDFSDQPEGASGELPTSTHGAEINH